MQRKFSLSYFLDDNYFRPNLLSYDEGVRGGLLCSTSETNSAADGRVRRPANKCSETQSSM
jgi:hypothetical protein